MYIERNPQYILISILFVCIQSKMIHDISFYLSR